MLTEEEVQQIFQRYRAGKASLKEQSMVKAWYAQLTEEVDIPDEAKLQAIEDEVYERIFEQPKIVKIKWWPRIYVAASILFCLGLGTYFLRQNTVQTVAQDIKPGHQQATLTLADGKKIVLTKGLNGQLAIQSNTSINADNNTITYNTGGKSVEPVYNTLSTAKGEQSPYPLILGDGTKIWLNAASSVTFPTAFVGSERIVKITGEAYFEVAHNRSKPFKVQTPTQTVEVLGTIFNVNAYADEPNTKTTLVEGAVKVSNVRIKPNEQTDGNRVWTVNTESFTAWKEGNFHFEGARIETIMRQLARWYNIEVVYEGKITDETFYAGVSRNLNISEVLKIFENSKGVKFKIEGRRVTVIE